jgi:hypothetical protein
MGIGFSPAAAGSILRGRTASLHQARLHIQPGLGTLPQLDSLVIAPRGQCFPVLAVRQRTHGAPVSAENGLFIARGHVPQPDVQIDPFVASEKVDPLYFRETSAYLVPDGPVGAKAYAVVQSVIAKDGKAGIGRVVLHNKEQLVLLRAVENLLVMQGLDCDFQVTKPAKFKDEVPAVALAPQEMQLGQALVDAITVPSFDLSKYKDLYTERLTQLIEAKVAGKELVAPPAVEHGHAINLMEALKQSVAQLQMPDAVAPAEGVTAEKPPTDGSQHAAAQDSGQEEEGAIAGPLGWPAPGRQPALLRRQKGEPLAQRMSEG